MSVPQTKQKPTSQQTLSAAEFKTQLHQALAKLADNSTLKTGQDEVRDLMIDHITDSERMGTFIHMISEFNELMKPNQKKEHMRLMSQIAEIFGENAIPFMPKILQFYQKKFKEVDPSLHQALAESMGNLIAHMFKKGMDQETIVDQLKILLRKLHQDISQPVKA